MNAKEETLHIRPSGCICDPFDLAAMGHMLNCPCYEPDLDVEDKQSEPVILDANVNITMEFRRATR